VYKDTNICIQSAAKTVNDTIYRKNR